ncbi:helix-turn-helix domain-containing protein [Nocardia sp. CA-135953]|uniref:helix-turn-helix domain-containing protein n=1 Tax=Nocardia sp. CA-135953 TaxID=3239978 RepID=UPI003D966330
MEQLDRVIADGVRRALGEAGIGIKDLVKGASIPSAVLRRQLAAEASFTLTELAAIAAVLGCRTVDLLPDLVRGQ